MTQHTKLMIAMFAASIAGFANDRAGQLGLTESVWYNIPYYNFSPTPQDVTNEQAYAAGNTPDLTFISTGSPLSDYANYAGNGYTALDARGFIYVPVAGNYTFNLGHKFNQVDDAARVTVDGSIIAEQNFSATYTDYAGTVNLSEGYHSFDLFYFQTLGGYNFSLSVTAPNGADVAFTTESVPDGGITAAMLGSTLLGLAALRRKFAHV